jgi:hypothetical protein
VVAIATAVAYAFHDFAAVTFFQTDDYLWRLWAVLEARPWRAFTDDLAAGTAFRPMRYLSWYVVERLIPHSPGSAPSIVLAGYFFYGCCAGLLAFQMSRDFWVGSTTAALAWLCPLLGRHALPWYSVLEDMIPPALVMLACSFVLVGRRTTHWRWLLAAVLLATVAGLWKEIAFPMPALALAVLLSAPTSPMDSVGANAKSASVPAASHSGSVNLVASFRSAFRDWHWWLPFVFVIMVLFGWRYLVIGGGGLIGHHGLLAGDSAVLRGQWENVAGLAGATPIGSFYVPAVARSFPVSMAAGPGAWSLTLQLICLSAVSLCWLLSLWASRDTRSILAAGVWYAISWLPAMTLTVVQPSYLFLPSFAVFFLVSLSLRKILAWPALLSAVNIGIATWLSIGTAGYFREAVPEAQRVRRETDSLLEMVRQEGERLPPGTRVFLLGSRVLRPDLIAELDAAYESRRCPLDLYNFAAPVELIAPAIPLDSQQLGPLEISTEGLREGHINMARRQFYFVTLKANSRQLADPALGNQFWTVTTNGWVDVTSRVHAEWSGR